MKLAFPLFSLCLAFFCCQNQPVSGGDVGGLVGTVAITVGDGSSSVATPSYKVVSAALAVCLAASSSLSSSFASAASWLGVG